MAEKQKLHLVVTEDRLKDVDLDTFYNVEGSGRAMIDFVAHFVADPESGEYLPQTEAVKKVTAGRKIRDIEEIYGELREAMDETAVPNG